MADFAELIDHLKTTDPGLSQAAVVGFGEEQPPQHCISVALSSLPTLLDVLE
eukprot:SAG31_NODE_688_length_12807_cov_6.395814_14_plen_52_part_00